MVGALVVAWQLSRHGMPIRGGSTRLPKAEARHFLRNFRALAVATSITLLTPLISQWLAGLLGPGSVSTLAYASRLRVVRVLCTITITITIIYSMVAGS